MNRYLTFFFLFSMGISYGQAIVKDSVTLYKKRVLESAEIEFLNSYYSQDGVNAAVSGGIGTEQLTDATATIVVSVPLNADDVLRLDAAASAYSSASSSNIDPFDRGTADPFQASSGASRSDIWGNVNIGYSHSSDDRNKIWSGHLSLSAEYDYYSAGLGGSHSWLFNEKNTEFSVNTQVYVDKWNAIYPIELRAFGRRGNGLGDRLFRNETITGNRNYSPNFREFTSTNRTSFALGLSFSQILHKNGQALFSLDLVRQQGLLSTPFHRVYFADVPDSFIDNFQLANDIERLPGNRLKMAFGGRINWYLNERISLRSYYRFYRDDWKIQSHTASLEIPIKITDQLTVYPSYRYYNQAAAEHFNAYGEALSTELYYTSDYDLSQYNSRQYGFGISYTDIFTRVQLWKVALKSIDLKFYHYNRNSAFNYSMVTTGLKFVIN